MYNKSLSYKVLENPDLLNVSCLNDLYYINGIMVMKFKPKTVKQNKYIRYLASKEKLYRNSYHKDGFYFVEFSISKKDFNTFSYLNKLGVLFVNGVRLQKYSEFIKNPRQPDVAVGDYFINNIAHVLSLSNV